MGNHPAHSSKLTYESLSKVVFPASVAVTAVRLSGLAEPCWRCVPTENSGHLTNGPWNMNRGFGMKGEQLFYNGLKNSLNAPRLGNVPSLFLELAIIWKVRAEYISLYLMRINKYRYENVYFFLFKDLIFIDHFEVHRYIEQTVKKFPIYFLYSDRHWSPDPIINTPTKVAHWLQLTNGYVIQSP